MANAQTPQERIAAMKARVEEKKRREQAERDRIKRRDAAVNGLAAQLVVELSDLRDLPLQPVAAVHGPRVAVRRDRNAEKDCMAVAVCVTSGDGSINYKNLVVFDVFADHDGTRSWLTHDDDEITIDIALDLATAAVEPILDA